MTSECKCPKYYVFYAMTVEGQARCLSLTNATIKRDSANLDGVIPQNNKTGILMIMDTKIHSIGF